MPHLGAKELVLSEVLNFIKFVNKQNKVSGPSVHPDLN